jgi:F-type H+/Na+-transporting ATPase subunit beta
MRGRIVAIHGDVVEVAFRNGLPSIHEALSLKRNDAKEIVLEVYEHTSGTTVKAIALGFTEGLKRGMEVSASG